ncbi:hypothetical protein Tco_1335873 [Tanacetum coccineum]
MKKDPHPTPTEFNAEVYDFLATHPAPFRKFSESFLCLVGISHYYELDDNVYPVFLADDNEEMDFFAFINHADPTKVRICEKQIEGEQLPLLESTRGRVVPLAGVNEQGNQNDNVQNIDAHIVQDEEVNVVADEEVVVAIADAVTIVDKPKGTRKKRKTASGASGSILPPRRLREDRSTSGDAGASIDRKSLLVLQDLLDSSTLAAEVSVTAAATIPFVTSFVTLHQSVRAAVAVDDEVTSIVMSYVPSTAVLTAAVANTVIVGATFALVHKPGTRPVHCSIFRDSASPSTAEANVVGPSQLAGVEVFVGICTYIK